jgi:hypothetical protein
MKATMTSRSLPHVLHSVLGGLLAAAAIAAAVTVGGVSFPESLAVDGHRLGLNGAGVHATWGVHLYAIALYLPTRSADLPAIREDDVPKAFRIEVLHSGWGPHAVPEQWQAELYPQLTPEAAARLKEAYAALTKGDVLVIAYVPAVGTHIRVNDQPLLAGQGPGLMRAFLNLWVGPHPISPELRHALLNGAP